MQQYYMDCADVQYMKNKSVTVVSIDIVVVFFSAAFMT